MSIPAQIATQLAKVQAERDALRLDRDDWEKAAIQENKNAQHYKTQLDALRLRLEKVERLGEALAASLESDWSMAGPREALQAWRNRDSDSAV